MDLVQGSGNMETLTNPSDSTAAAGPCWVLLNRYGYKDDHSQANAKTAAACCTSSGRPFSVSFTVAAPPACSSVHGDWLGRTPPHRDDDDNGSSSYSIGNDKHSKDIVLKVVAAHDDSVLIEMSVPHPACSSRVVFDYFLYEAGAGRTFPSLSLLPGCYVSYQFNRDKDARQVPTRSAEARNLSCFKTTGILRCGDGDGEVLVAQLEVGYDEPFDTAELCVLRAGAQDWVLRRLPVIHHEGEKAGEVRQTRIDAAVPVGSRFMCWVDYVNGILLCDMAEDNENPKMWYVPLPALPPKPGGQYGNDRPYMRYCRNLAAAGPGAVRLVSIAPRCCCGGPGQTSCERSSSAFNVTTWTLSLSNEEPMAWIKDAVLDCNELWQLPRYGRLPRVAPNFPSVSSDDPDIVCFTISEDSMTRMVEINTRSKALLSADVNHHKKFYVGSELIWAKLRW